MIELRRMSALLNLPQLLPNEYLRVEYIKPSSLGAYIDTGVVLNEDTRIEVDFLFDYTIPSSGQHGVVGFFDGSHNHFVIQSTWLYPIQGLVKSCYLPENKSEDSGVLSFNTATRHVGGLHNTYVELDGVKRFNAGSPITNTLYGGCIHLFKSCYRHTPTNVLYSQVNIYNCKIEQNGILIRNFIPCYRKEDQVAGLYDIVDGVFYTNDGTSRFIAGSITN